MAGRGGGRSTSFKPGNRANPRGRPLEYWRLRCLSAALRRSGGRVGQALEGLKVARPWFENRHKNCCANIVMSIALPNRTSELIAGTFGIPECHPCSVFAVSFSLKRV